VAGDDEDLGTDGRIRSQVGRTALNWVVVGLSLATIGAWAWTGIYQLDPGEAAVVLRLGKYNRTVSEPGLKWLLPAPLEYASVVNVTEIRRQEFGAGKSLDGEARDYSIQTVDSNIVNLRYVMTYQVDDAFSFVFGMASPDETLHDAAQAAVRQVVGQRNIDAVLSGQRQSIEDEAHMVLTENLESYFPGENRSPFQIQAIQFQIVQPPAQVQAAFDDVVAAQQDEVRAVSVARGDAREISARADAKAVELEEQSQAYKDSMISKSRGEADRFSALVAEYERSPEVTRRRLYLETMEQVLPRVEMLIVEPNTVNMFPVLPQQRETSPPAAILAPSMGARAPEPSTESAAPEPSGGGAAPEASQGSPQ
jgi:membrane protease subunit HflK